MSWKNSFEILTKVGYIIWAYNYGAFTTEYKVIMFDSNQSILRESKMIFFFLKSELEV
jgi:hypothetical protein